MIKIQKKGDSLSIQNVVVLIYGQPGIGKTSLACSAKNPLLLDFDWGAHRSRFRGDVVRPEMFKDVSDISAEDVKGYDTLVLDTVGRCLDLMQVEMPAYSGKTQLKTPSGALTLQGFGQLKYSFQAFLKRLLSFRKNIVLVAHEREDKDGDNRIFRPDVVGGSLDEIYRSSDAIGYLYQDNGSRVLGFAPTSQWRGKDPAGIGSIKVPDLSSRREFFQEVIDRIVSSMTEPAGDRDEEVEDALIAIANTKTLEQFQHMWGLLKSNPTFQEQPYKAQIKEALKRQADKLGLVFDKEEGVWKTKPASAEEFV